MVLFALQKSRHRDRVTGVDSVQYDLISRHNITVDGAPVTVLNVELRCDLTKTPWCISHEAYDAIQQYLRTKDTLVPHNIKGWLPNGTYAVVNTTMAKPQAPVGLHNFINLRIDLGDKKS